MTPGLNRRWLLSGILALSSLSCDESLPPPETPPVPLRATLQVLSFGPYVTIRNGAPTGTAGAFQLSVTNVYDEVLQDSATVEVALEVWLRDRPEIRAAVVADVSSLTTHRVVLGGITTLEPDSTAILLKQWTHRTQDGIPYWDYVATHPMMTAGGVPFCESDTLHFVVRGAVRLFKFEPSLIFPEQEFPIVYQIFDLPCRQPEDTVTVAEPLNP